MTGLLHRLAARATGTAWTVRSDARLPFGAGQLREGETTQESVAPALAPATPYDAAPPLHAAATRSAAHPSATPTHPAPDSADLPMQTPRAHTSALRSPVSDAPAFAAPMPESHPLQQPHTSHAVDMLASPQNTDHDARLLPAATHLASTSARPGVPMPAPAHTPTSRDAPAPLMPIERASGDATGNKAAMTSAPPAPWSRMTPQQPTHPDTEVHIHIGRIDVTALHEAPKPKARTAERQRTQPVSLDAYLANRASKG